MGHLELERYKHRNLRDYAFNCFIHRTSFLPIQHGILLRLGHPRFDGSYFYKVFRFERKIFLLLYWLRLFFFFPSRRFFGIYFAFLHGFCSKFQGNRNFFYLLLIKTKNLRYQLPVTSYCPLKRFFGLWFPDKDPESSKPRDR